MKRHSSTFRHARAAISTLMDLLIARRLERDPGASEADARANLWRTLAEQAGLHDPNQIDRPAAEAVVWVLSALLELEGDGSRHPEC